MNYNFPFDNLVLGQVLFFGKSLQRAIFLSKFKQSVGGFSLFCMFWAFFLFIGLATLNMTMGIVFGGVFNSYFNCFLSD